MNILFGILVGVVVLLLIILIIYYTLINTTVSRDELPPSEYDKLFIAYRYICPVLGITPNSDYCSDVVNLKGALVAILASEQKILNKEKILYEDTDELISAVIELADEIVKREVVK